MKITPNNTLKKSLIKSYWRETRKVLVKVRQQVITQSETTDPETLRMMLPHLLQVTPMVDQLQKIWGEVGGRFALDTHLKINRQKAGNESYQVKEDKLKDYQRRMRTYAAQRSALKAKAILDTETQAINRVITDVIERASKEGLSIPNTRNLMKDSLLNELTIIENYQAERIARTEVNGAANTGSFESAREDSRELGMKLNKEWMTSGLPNVRESHINFESLGMVEEDYEYAPGLQFPGDENGEAEEVINCRCSYVLETAEN